MPITLDEGGAVFNIDAYSGSDDQKFASALAAAAVSGGVLFIRQRSSVWSLTTSRTVPATVTLQVANGGTLSLAAGVTLTVAGPVDAGPHHVFAGEGTVTFSQPKAFAYPEWWGVDGVSDEVQIQAALNACREVRLVPGKTYVGTGASGTGRDVPSGRTLQARGATLQNIGFYHQTYATDITFVGGTWTSTSANENEDGSTRYLDTPFSIYGTRVRVLDAVVTGEYWGTGVALQYSSQDCRVNGLQWDAGNSGADGVVVQGSGHRITSCRLKGFDDGVVLKAVRGNTENIMISNIFAEGLASVVAVGTEVGSPEGQLPRRVVRNVVATNLVGKNVSYAVYFKFGKDLTSLEFGTLENVRVSGVRVYDDGTYLGGTGQHRFITLIRFDAKRGATMRGIIVSDCTARVRCGSSQESNLVALLAEGIGNDDGVQRDTVIEDVVIENVRGVDLYGGVENGVDGATGDPIDRGILVGEGDAGGFIRNVVFRNVSIDGCELDGGSINAPSSSGDIVLEGMRVRRAARSTTTTAWPLSLIAGKVKVSGLDLDTAGLPSVPIRITDAVTLTAEVVPYKMSNLGATEALGGGQGAPALLADRPTWVYQVEAVASQPLAGSDTDYRTLRMDKHGGAMLFSANTSATLANRVTIAAYTPVRLHSSTYLTSAQSFFAPGEILKLTSAVTGSRPISEMHLQLHVVRY